MRASTSSGPGEPVATADPQQARQAAEDLLDEFVRPYLDEEIVTTDVREYATCWVIGYNTRVYVETGSISHALAGGGPVIVNRRTGLARLGTSAYPVEAQLDPP